MKALVLRCDHCGAPLDVQDSRRVVCTYCEKTNVLLAVSEEPLTVDDGLYPGAPQDLAGLRRCIDTRCRALLKMALGVSP